MSVACNFGTFAGKRKNGNLPRSRCISSFPQSYQTRLTNSELVNVQASLHLKSKSAKKSYILEGLTAVGVFHTPAVKDKLATMMGAAPIVACGTHADLPRVAEKALAPEHPRLKRYQKDG